MGDGCHAHGHRSLQPLLHRHPTVCAHPTTFRCRLPPLLIVKSPLAAGDCQQRSCLCRPCWRRCCRCHRCLRLRLCLPCKGCRGAPYHTSCWRNGVGDGICATHNRLWCAPQTTIVARGREGGGGEDNLKPPTAAAWATAATPAGIVLCDHPSEIDSIVILMGHEIVKLL